MDARRVIIVIGAGRSGTSTITRGIGALGAELGDNLKPGSPKNPKGFFEDLELLDINQRLHKVFGLTTTGSDVRFEDATLYGSSAVSALRQEARGIIEQRFGTCALWAFKSGGILRLLPFWLQLFSELDMQTNWVLALRHPAKVAKSRARLNPLRGMQDKSDFEWLSRVVPYLHLLQSEPWCVLEYDDLLQQPREELYRVARCLDIPVVESVERSVETFATEFINPKLQHHTSVDSACVNPLALEAYSALAELTKMNPDAAFWRNWRLIRERLEMMAPALRHIDYLENKLRGARWGLDDGLRILLRRSGVSG